MSTRHLRYLFNPASVALIGASERPGSLGAALTRNLLGGGFQGELFLVNRRHRHVREMPAYPHPADLPRAPELAIIATPARTVLELLAELGRRGTKTAVIASDTGARDAAEADILHRAWREAARPYGLRLLGPASVGVMAPRCGLNASLGHLFPQPGPLALVAQSGAVQAPLLEWAAGQGIGFSSVVAMGGQIDIDSGDLLDWLAHDPATRVILLDLEQVTQVRSFLSAARATAQLKPVLVMRAGRGGDAASRQADAIHDAAFRRAGLLRVRSLRELFWTAATLAFDLPVIGDRLAILGNSRGLGLLAADALLAAGGRLARLGPETGAELRQILPVGVAPGNPLDLGAAAVPAQFAAVLDILLRDRGIDGVLVSHAPNALVPTEDTAAAVIEAVDRCRAPAGERPAVLTCWLGVDSVHAARQRCLERRIPTFDAPDDAVRAFMRCWRHQRNQVALMETPPDTAESYSADPAVARQIARRALAAGRDALNATEAAALLKAYGIAVSEPEVTAVQPADSAPPELSIRTVDDSVFGPVLLVGPGGRTAALVDGVVAALPPLDPVLARQVIARLPIGQASPEAGTGLLEGVAPLLVKVARLIADLDEVIELELNPVLVGVADATVGAARIRVAAGTAPIRERLAIRPYPGELEETLPLPDGSTLLIRPVRPEDAPGFVAGFARLTTEDIRMRFMHVVKELTAAEAARLTRIDYDREMALVALRQRPGQPPEGCGVARIVGEPDRERVEFAIILLRDATGIGLGSLLLRRLILYARDQGFRELFGEILRENEVMLELCRTMGFTIRVCPEDSGVMLATLRLD